MAHEIENLDNVMLFKKSAWHGLGMVVDEEYTAIQSAEKVGLLYPVDQWGLSATSTKGKELVGKFDAALAKGELDKIRNLHAAIQQEQVALDTHVANMRTGQHDGQDVRELMGVVGADYAVCQNRELAEFTDALAQTGKVVIESCGSIRNGKRVWFLARGDVFCIGNAKLSKPDNVFPYVLVSNGHDGGQALRVTPTTIRVVCSNTLHMVITRETGCKADSAAIVIRHSGRIMDKLARAKEAMAHYGTTLARNTELFEALQAKKINDDQRMGLFATSYAANWIAPTAEELASKDGQVKKTALNRQERMIEASQCFLKRYKEEKAEFGHGDTAWVALNAMTGYLQHERVVRGKDTDAAWCRKLDQNLFGQNADRSQDILNYATSM